MAHSLTVNFMNARGDVLSGRLDVPETFDETALPPFGIYAHCFTCTKNISSAHNICQKLADLGIAMLRFDFSGLGESQGAFEDTTVSRYIDDIISAHRFLSDHYAAPTLLVGHSLGGLAAHYAADDLDSLITCVSLNAPATTKHTKNRIKDPNQNTLHTLDIMGREYLIKPDFLKDLDLYTVPNFNNTNVHRVILHERDDTIVPFYHAQRLYDALTMNKSLIQLTNTDHLIKNRDTAYRMAQIIYLLHSSSCIKDPS